MIKLLDEGLERSSVPLSGNIKIIPINLKTYLDLSQLHTDEIPKCWFFTCHNICWAHQGKEHSDTHKHLPVTPYLKLQDN